MHKIISFVLFNGIWFSAVVGRGDYLADSCVSADTSRL